MNLVDTHCHLQFPKLAANSRQVVERAQAANVNKLVCVGTTLKDSRQAVGFAGQFNNVWAAVGVHPHDAKDFPDNGTHQLSELLQQSKAVAIGEIGLDFYKQYSPPEVQVKILRQQIEASLDSGLPYIFHVREAFDDFWPVFESYSRLSGVVHSFSAGRKDMEQILEHGLYVGLNGIMTFTKDKEQLAAAKAVPLTRLVLETDAPFLTPAAKRGQTCEPAFVRNTAEFLAGLRGESLNQLAAATTQNAEELFSL